MTFFLSLMIVGVLMIFYAMLSEIKTGKSTLNLSSKDSAMGILEKRFAKGEISQEEFQKNKELLGDK